MTWSNLMKPPVTAPLWAAIRDRIKHAALDAILGGPDRVYVEGEQSASGEDVETAAWGRVVVVPAILPGGAPYSQGYPVRLSFLVRAEFNSRPRPNYNVSLPLELAQSAAYDRLQHWTWAPGASSKVMVAMGVLLDTLWEPVALYDPGIPGVVFMSSRYRVEAARAPA